MKKILSTLLVLTNIYAQQMTIECEMPGLTTENQFALYGNVVVDGDEFEANFQVFTRARGNESEVVEFGLQRSGKVITYPAGDITINEITQLQSVEKEGFVQFVNLVGNFPGLLSSTIRFQSGYTYRSMCTIHKCEATSCLQ